MVNKLNNDIKEFFYNFFTDDEYKDIADSINIENREFRMDFYSIANLLHRNNLATDLLDNLLSLMRITYHEEFELEEEIGCYIFDGTVNMGQYQKVLECIGEFDDASKSYHSNSLIDMIDNNKSFVTVETDNGYIYYEVPIAYGDISTKEVIDDKLDKLLRDLELETALELDDDEVEL